jgi:hypothetical protein
MPRFLLALTLLSALGAALPAEATAQRRTTDRNDRTEYAVRLDTTFAFGARGSAELTLRAGDIIVRAWSEPRVRIRAMSERSLIRLDASGGNFFALGLRDARGGDTRFEVTVPVGTRLRVGSQSGDISITGTKGEIEARTNNGDIDIEDAAGRVEIAGVLSGDVAVRRVAGDLRIGTVSGDVDLDDITGDVEVETVSGDVDLRRVTSKRIRARTTNGDVTFDGAIDAAGGRYDFASHSGEVELTVPRSTSARVTVSTFSGGIESDFPITLNPGEHGKRFTFDIGKGEARVSAESFSGDVTIHQRDARPRARDRR